MDIIHGIASQNEALLAGNGDGDVLKPFPPIFRQATGQDGRGGGAVGTWAIVGSRSTGEPVCYAGSGPRITLPIGITRDWRWARGKRRCAGCEGQKVKRSIGKCILLRQLSDLFDADV